MAYRDREFVLHDVQGYLCTATAGPLELLQQRASDYEPDSSGGLGWDEYATEPLLVAQLTARSGSCKNALWARDASLPPAGIARVSTATGAAKRDVRAAFREQIEGQLEGGADALIFETFSDLEELLLGVAEARALGDLPIIAQMTFGEELVAIDGTTPQTAATALATAGVEIAAASKSQGLVEVIRRHQTLLSRAALLVSSSVSRVWWVEPAPPDRGG